MARSKYTEIPSDEETPGLFSGCSIRKKNQVEFEEDMSSQIMNGCLLSEVPLLNENSEICSDYCCKHRRKSSETVLRQGSTCGTLKNRQRKSHSLPSSSSLSSIGSGDNEVLQITPEDFASQLTLTDLTIFSRITPDEFLSCAWNKKNKLEVSPNIVSFTKRFNQVSFWTVQEVLRSTLPKVRAEVVSHFIRISKKLYDHNNYHSLFAIISALRSAPIYRLNKTWGYVSKKDKQTFDKLSDVFSESDNWKNLREHVENLRLPCIPYLGMFLTDIVYVNMAHPHSGGLETDQRRFKMNNILRVISHLQQSKYELAWRESVHQYFDSINYIEELQKFIEDDQYKLSLRLEPMRDSPAESAEFTYDQYLGAGTVASLNLSPAKLPSKSYSSKFGVNNHRKCHSLGTNVLNTMPNKIEAQQRHLLDDSVLEENGPQIVPIKISLTRSWSSNHNNTEELVLLEGLLKKKIVFKNGCHPTVSSWHRYWVQASDSSLLFYPPKSFKGYLRNDFKKEPSKIWSIKGFLVTLNENPEVFLLKDTSRSKLYKFRAVDDSAALNWYRTLYNIAEGKREQITPSNLITFE